MQGLDRCVLFCRFVCSFVTLRGSSHVQWGLLLTCRVANRRVDVFMWLGLLPDRNDVVVGSSERFWCQRSVCFRDILIAPFMVVLAFSAV